MRAACCSARPASRCWQAKVLASKDAKKVYVQTAAAALRARDCVMDTVNKVQENAEDVLAEAKAVNEARAQQAQDAQEEEEVPAE